MIRQLWVNGKPTLSSSGVYTGITTGTNTYTSRVLAVRPRVHITDTALVISDINYGGRATGIRETWRFRVDTDGIAWDLTRTCSNAFQAEDMSFPRWNFASLSVWKGGIIDNGGMVWCKYFKEVDDTYGVHTGGTTFWNADSGYGLSIRGTGGEGMQIATKYSHSPQGEFTSTQLVTRQLLHPRYHLNRFVSKKADVFAPFEIGRGSVTAHFKLQYVDYFKEYDRGHLASIDAAAVRELLNTTARYGVVDNNIVGGNGWLTNWKCLHEPFFARIALALDDSNYTHNLAATLDQERDQAMTPDGRVLSRWHGDPGDEMPGTYDTSTGYYEAQWGYTMDSQTGYVINVCELFNLTGKLSWLRGHQRTCEKALDWVIRRDANHNGLFEMVNQNIREKKCSDWIDIVWAGYENAFINAQMYGALMEWAACERLLGDQQAADHYSRVAARLKNAFNKPVEQGGFWLAAKKQYVYWRDDDGSVHGDNLVTPVNLMAVAFGICDDQQRINQLIGQIEQRTSAEKLFHWPLCFDSFKRDEVDANNWPFPRYENGDIFPSWGYLGIMAYVKYNKKLALKYIMNLLNQYKKDGLSSQRYSRITGKGLGNDILAGICTGITALYTDIYGIRPGWNRLVLAPHLTKGLNGTRFHYLLRDTLYDIRLDANRYRVATPFYSVTCGHEFGVSGKPGEIHFFPGSQDTTALTIRWEGSDRVDATVKQWDEHAVVWKVNVSGTYTFTFRGLPPGRKYLVSMKGSRQTITSGDEGRLVIRQSCTGNAWIRLTPIP